MSQSDVVFVVGTGISAATSGNAATATWVGLVKSGISRARQVSEAVDDEWERLVQGLLAYGLRSGSVETIIKAAGMVSTALKDVGDIAFNDWLSDDVGGLQVQSTSAASALLAFPFPILTTNYDTLLEQVGSRHATDWTDPAGFHEVVTRASDAIGHLHGVWNRPGSVVLTEGDYARLLAHDSTKALEQAMATLKSIVYVGFGGGLSDPNFATLLEWHRRTFPQSSVTHYRLCRAEEESPLLRAHANDHVVPVVYGDTHDDLPSFLARYAPATSDLVTNEAGLARDVVQEARELLRESMTTESVLADASGGDLAVRDLVLPPILLPVPHATFVRERIRRGRSEEVERLSGHDEVLSHDFFVVVGDDGSGLTTAVKWLATESSNTLGSAAPLFIRFSDCRIKRDPFGIAVRNASIGSGLVQDRDMPLPPHVVAVDDVSASIPRVSDRVLAGIISSDAIVKILGCRQGDEDELISRLRELGVSPRVVFLGRMRRSDISELARKLAPGEADRIAEEAVRVLEAEGLRRTPFTVSLLLYLALKGNTTEARSLTNVLDSYTSLLLGIGDPHTNDTGLTESDLSAILANFAESLIWDEKPTVEEAEALRIIGEVVTRFGWQASPTSVLRGLLHE
ncbi:SIR2 family protein [Microbacterium saccharophilum]|uniref:SIR2 family protein n=2 Tax=Microbacterium saccharophilum TaxID=1213358 RepID=A0A5C8I5P7_9MICO|nr:SIR2 family protein [Microbacterium saccharophilum]TXK14387.1 SIR2 family protein [Microbacterium saccharophilum]